MCGVCVCGCVCVCVCVCVCGCVCGWVGEWVGVCVQAMHNALVSVGFVWYTAVKDGVAPCNGGGVGFLVLSEGNGFIHAVMRRNQPLV